nr:MAG TPA: hypothetical protein [Caudoviricetes sp.]
MWSSGRVRTVSPTLSTFVHSWFYSLKTENRLISSKESAELGKTVGSHHSAHKT